MTGTLRRRVGADITRRLLSMHMTKDWFRVTASSSRPYSGLMAVREEEVSEEVGEEMHARRD